MNIKIIFFTFLFLFIIGCIYAGDNNTTNDKLIPKDINTYNNIVIANESGHFNTSFSDGSNGYCLEYGEQEANKDDEFYKVNTSYAINNVNQKPIGDYLKTFFIDYYNIANKDKIATQHYIWAFSDDFNSWRINQSLVDYIKLNPSFYPDHGEKQINNTTKMVYSFSVLLSKFLYHQNYFTYKIYFENITSNSTIQINNSTTNNSIITNNTIQNNISNIQFNDSIVIDEVILSHSSILSNNKISFSQNTTGYSVYLILICILLIIIISIKIKY